MNAFGQDVDKDLWDELKSKAVVLKVEAEMNIPEQGLWSGEISKITLPGRAVLFTLEGKTLKLKTSLTPYLQEDGSYLLIAQGQMWYKEDNTAQYKTVFKSLKIHPNEALFYYPLGISATGDYIIELEIILRKLDEKDP